MKVRTGFVSNSSSSSFLLFTKEPLSKADRSEFVKMLGVKEGSIADAVFGPLVDLIRETTPMDLKKFLKNFGYKSKEEALEENEDYKVMIELLEAGWEAREITGSNEDYGPEAYFYYCSIDDVEKKDFRIFFLD